MVMQIRMQIADDTVGLTALSTKRLLYSSAQRDKLSKIKRCKHGARELKAFDVVVCTIAFVLVSERFSSAIYAYDTVNCQHKQD